MPPKKHAVKGEPDFHFISDEKLKSFMDLTQQMIFSYKRYDKEKTKVLEEILKDLSWEDADRLSRSAIEELERQEKEGRSPDSPTPMLKKVPKVRKSPAKRKI